MPLKVINIQIFSCNNFIKNVLENNTTYVLAERIPENIVQTDRIILVKNVEIAIEKMAIYRRNQIKGTEQNVNEI